MTSAGASDKLPILHLSDLHFGVHGPFDGEEPERLARILCEAVAELQKANEGCPAPQLIIASGDLTLKLKALPTEFALASRFFRALADILDLDSSRFVFVPGNHDISWYKCLNAVNDLEEAGRPVDEATLRTRLDEVKLSRYDEFVIWLSQRPFASLRVS